MKLTVAFVILLFAGHVNSQNPHWQWAQAIDSLNFDAACVATDSAGNTYVTGSFVKNPTIGNTKLNNYGAYDVFLVKFDKNGNVVWANSYGGANGDLANDISLDAKGNIIIVGSVTEDIIYFNLQPVAQTGSQVDGYVAKFHPNGTLLFFKRMPGNFSEMAFATCTDTKGNILVEGYYVNHLNKFVMGPDTLAPTGVANSKSYIAKLDPQGNILWSKNCFANHIIYQTKFFIRTDGNDNIYTATNVWIGKDSIFSFGSAVYTTKGTCDTYLGKLDPNGNELWSHHFSGSGFQYPRGMAVDKAGGFVHLAIDYNSPVLNTGNQQYFNQGIVDFVLFKFDVYGNLLAANNFGTSERETAGSLITDNTGNVYCFATSFADSLSLGTSKFYKNYSTDPSLTSSCFIFKTDQGGNIPWVKHVEGSMSTREPAVTADNLKNLYVFGIPGIDPQVKTTCVFDQDTIYPGSVNNIGLPSWYSFFLAKLYDSTMYVNPTGIQENPREQFFYGPNPAADKIFLRVENAEKYNVTILNELGQMLREEIIEGEKNQVDISSLPPGVYFMELQNSETRITKKLIIGR